jgi:hypothetical protein
MLSPGRCDHESREVCKNPAVLQRFIDDSQKLPGQGDDGFPRSLRRLDAGIVVSQVRAVAPGDQGALHQSCSTQLIAAFGDPTAPFRLVGIGHPGHNAEVGRQLVLIGKIVDIADGG